MTCRSGTVVAMQGLGAPCAAIRHADASCRRPEASALVCAGLVSPSGAPQIAPAPGPQLGAAHTAPSVAYILVNTTQGNAFNGQSK